MSKSKKFVLEEGRGSLWAVAKKDRVHKKIRYNGQIMLNGKLHWITLFKNGKFENSPDFNVSLGSKVKKIKK